MARRARLCAAASPQTFDALLALVHPDDRERVARLHADPAQVQAGLDFEFRLQHPTRGERWILSRSRHLAVPGEAGRLVGVALDITERKRAEAALREREARLRALVAASSYAVYRMSPDWSQMLRLDGQGFIPNTDGPSTSWLEEYIHPEDQPQVVEAIQAAIRTRTMFELEHRVRRVDGTLGWTLSRAVPLLDEHGEVAEWFGAASDVTARKRAEEALRESEERQAFLLKFSDALRPLADPIAVQETAMRLLGPYLGVTRALYYTIDEEGGASAASGFNIDPVPLPPRLRVSDLGADLFATFQTGKDAIWSDTATDPRISEAERPVFLAIGVRANISVPLIKAGRFVAALAVHSPVPREWVAGDLQLVKDVAERTWAAVERVRAEQALHASEEQYRTLFTSIDEGFCVIEVVFDEKERAIDYHFLDVNPSFERQTGIANAIGKRMREIAPQHEDYWFEIYGRIARTGESLRFENRAAQLHRWYDVYAFRVGGPHDRKVAVLFNDITARKQAEAALRESEARFRTLADAVPQVIWTNEAGGVATYFNERWYTYSGLSEEQSVGLGWQAIVHPDDAPASVERWQQALAAGEVFDVEYRLRRHDGAYCWHIGRNVPLRDEGGCVIGWFGSATDIEELKQAEAAVQRANEELEGRVAARTAELERLSRTRRELLGRLVTAQEDERRRIARELHDSLGQYLSALTLDLARLQAIAGTPPDAQTGLARLQTVAKEIDDELDQLTMELRPPALDDLGLDEALGRYAQEWTATSGIPVDVFATGFGAGRLPLAVEATAYRIAQEALTNIRKHAGAHHVSVLLERKADELRVIVEDDGVGFAPDAVIRERRGGRQLGLVGMRERATLAGGTIAIESEPGNGTTIFLHIPIHDEHHDSSEGQAHA